MTKGQLELKKLALTISELNYTYCEIRVNRRYEEYFVDKYSRENGMFLGAIMSGTYKETWCFLQGLLNAAWLSNPF